MAKVIGMRGVTYDLKEDWVAAGEKEAGKEFDMTSFRNINGFIAQELVEHVPEVVEYHEERDLLSVNYDGLIPVLVEAIKEQQQQIEELKNEVEQLKHK